MIDFFFQNTARRGTYAREFVARLPAESGPPPSTVFRKLLMEQSEHGDTVRCPRKHFAIDNQQRDRLRPYRWYKILWSRQN